MFLNLCNTDHLQIGDMVAGCAQALAARALSKGSSLITAPASTRMNTFLAVWFTMSCRYALWLTFHYFYAYIELG